MTKSYKAALNCGHVRLIRIGSEEDADAREKGWTTCLKHRESISITNWIPEPGDQFCDCGKGAFCPQFGTLFNQQLPSFIASRKLL